jgi:hypothetical protein
MLLASCRDTNPCPICLEMLVSFSVSHIRLVVLVWVASDRKNFCSVALSLKMMKGSAAVPVSPGYSASLANHGVLDSVALFLVGSEPDGEQRRSLQYAMRSH